MIKNNRKFSNKLFGGKFFVHTAMAQSRALSISLDTKNAILARSELPTHYERKPNPVAKKHYTYLKSHRIYLAHLLRNEFLTVSVRLTVPERAEEGWTAG